MRTAPKELYIAALLLGLASCFGIFGHQHYDGDTGLLDVSGRAFVVFWTASILVLGGQDAEVFNPAPFLGMQERLFGGLRLVGTRSILAWRPSALLLAKTNGWLRWPRPTTARRDADLGALRLPPEGRAQ